jgi:aspartyl-tRNA(Asn)/glutamyl-tRNA(Gln) amidotransferase subunit C
MFSEQEIRKIASLARLTLTSAEASHFTTQLSDIFEYVQKLMAVNVEGIEPLSHVHGVTNVFREDRVGASLDTEEALKSAPDTSENSFRVPLIIE